MNEQRTAQKHPEPKKVDEPECCDLYGEYCYPCKDNTQAQQKNKNNN